MLKTNFSPFPSITTERLMLRKITVEDAEAIYMLRSDERVNQYIDRPKASSIDDARNFINQIRSRVISNELLYWAITQKKDHKLIGTIVFWNIVPEKDSAEVAFELLPDFQGQGLMREALSAVIQYGFNDLGLKVIEALPEERNEKSIALLERNGFKLDEDFDANGDHGDISVIRYQLYAHEMTLS